MLLHLKEQFDTKVKCDAKILVAVQRRAMHTSMDLPPSDRDIRRAIAKLQNDKSGGKDDIPAEHHEALATDPDTFGWVRDMVLDHQKSGSGTDPPQRPPDPEPPPPSAPSAISSSSACSSSPSQCTPRAARQRRRERREAQRDQQLPQQTCDSSHLKCDGWLTAELALLPKKPDLGQCKNWRAACMLDVSSKIFSSILLSRLHGIIEWTSMECQARFRRGRGVRDAFWSLQQGMKLRQSHQQDSWACFLDLVRAVDAVNRQLLFDCCSKQGIPPRFINLLTRLHNGSKAVERRSD